MPPQLGRGEKIRRKARGSRQGQEHHSELPSGAKKTQLGKINSIYCKSNQSRVMRNETKSLNTFPHPLLLPGLNFTSNFLHLLPPRGIVGWGMGLRSVHHTLSLLFLPPQEDDSSQSSPAPAWGPFHGRQLSMNCFNMSPSHRLQFFMNCSSVGLFHRVQSFRNRLFQRGSPMES